MKNKVIIICLYFGRLPNYFQLFLDSCARNPRFDWLIVSDDKSRFRVPENVRLIHSVFEDVAALIKSRLDFDIGLRDKYKLCDFKPLYGEIFEEYVRGYSCWGHCDLDVIWGDLKKFITDERLAKYDRILDRGHLSIYKNSKAVNGYYKSPYSGIDYRTILAAEEHFGFDEMRGLNQIYSENGYSCWNEPVAADISFYSLPLRLTRGENYAGQRFKYDGGRILQTFPGEKRDREFAYIHLQKRSMKVNFSLDQPVSSYEINPRGFDLRLSEREYQAEINFARRLLYKIKMHAKAFKIKLDWNLVWKRHYMNLRKPSA